MYKKYLINADVKQENNTELSYYNLREKRLISKVQNLDWMALVSFPIPEDFDWFDWEKIPFRRDCSIEELSLIEKRIK